MPLAFGVLLLVQGAALLAYWHSAYERETGLTKRIMGSRPALPETLHSCLGAIRFFGNFQRTGRRYSCPRQRNHLVRGDTVQKFDSAAISCDGLVASQVDLDVVKLEE